MEYYTSAVFDFCPVSQFPYFGKVYLIQLMFIGSFGTTFVAIPLFREGLSNMKLHLTRIIGIIQVAIPLFREGLSNGDFMTHTMRLGYSVAIPLFREGLSNERS